ncbi:MAG: response regulator, partial [Acidimicrobiales bacterium]|nr:response regulator [Acidimicrobiales bacterium]
TPQRVLIVDDDDAKRLGLVAILAPLPLDVIEATSAVEALRILMTQDFSVILLDVRMPGMSGFEAAALIRQRRQSESTPIIFITSYDHGDVSTAEQYALGAVDFMFAPVSPNELRAKVSVFANLRARAEELSDRAVVLQAAADQFRLVADAAPVGIFQTDAEDRYVYTNPCWSAITGIPAEEALGTVWGSTSKPTTGDGLVVTLADTDVASADHRVEIELEGGHKRILVATSTILPDGAGGTRGRVGTVADATAEVRVEAALCEARDKANEASSLKSDFLANMSHEIRTPMNGVLGMTDLLLETDLDATQRDYAQTVRNSGEALLTIINDILDFSKIEAGKVDVEVVEFDVRSIVDDVLKLLRGTAEAKNLELRSSVDVEIPELVRGDPGRLRQVLMNLVGNAVKFTPAGHVAVRVCSTESESDEDSLLRFDITDTGVGVPETKLATIFEPFMQGDASTSRKHGGTGLGLAISAQLVSLMGGDCGVFSSADSGSTFWFTVRTRRALDRAGLQLHKASESDPAPLPDGAHRGRLLLAEDNMVNERVARAMLTKAGFEIDSVKNGAEAVAAAAATAYDAILMDCQMPVLNGYEATALIRAGEGVGTHVPIIAVTAGARIEDRDRCLSSGMDDYISKPVSKDALVGVVSRWLRKTERVYPRLAV